MRCAYGTIMMTIVLSWAATVWADSHAHPYAHTHIGINPTLRPDWNDPGNRALDTDTDPTDNNKLWFFSVPPVHTAGTPGWPNWSHAEGSTFLLAVPEHGPGDSAIIHPTDPTKQLYTCEFMWSKANGYDDPDGYAHLDGWHSAHGPGGMWSLESVDQQTTPAWNIYIKREGTSLAEQDFFMETPGGLETLTTNGSTHQLKKTWLDDNNAWGIHEHMSFYFWLAADGSDIGNEVSVTFSAFDMGGLYTASDPFTLTFVVVPEPASLGLLILGGLVTFARRRY
ncbi:MAG: PEP-CTERM sorting domain-containing protein [Phycisphaerales bacterium]|nr:PEP-CTERM sorting domain-containing protein [Phycisphaerales bacterium]